MTDSLATAAILERDARANHYPAQIAAGTIAAEEAEADYRAWCAIALWFESRSTVWTAWDLSWAELEHAAAGALVRRQQACEAKPDSQPLATRRDNVSAILTALRRQRADIDALNARLRARAQRAAA